MVILHEVSDENGRERDSKLKLSGKKTIEPGFEIIKFEMSREASMLDSGSQSGNTLKMVV